MRLDTWLDRRLARSAYGAAMTSRHRPAEAELHRLLDIMAALRDPKRRGPAPLAAAAR